MTLPIWITPRMKECFETMLEELLLHNSHAILTFTIYGVTIGNVNTQEQQIITVHELSEDSKLIDEFLNNDPELYDSPVEKIEKPIINLTKLLETPSVDEPTVIFDPTFEEIKAEDLIDVEKLFTPFLTNNTSTNDDIEKEISSTSTQVIITEESKKKTYDPETWKIQLEDLLRRVYNEQSDQVKRTILYYKIGNLIANPPTKYKFQQYKVKDEISKSLGIRIGEKQFVTARNTYKIFDNETQIQQQETPLTITRIRRMKNHEILKYRENF